MKKIDNFTNQYSLSKTLRFSLMPVGKTEENFNNALLLEKDKERAQKYDKVKKYIDRYHKYFINEILSDLQLTGTDEYADLYFKSGKDEKDIKAMENLESKLRKNIASAFSKDKRFNSLFKKEMIEQILPSFLTSQQEKDDVMTFYGFATYFTTGLLENRKNMYSDKPQTSAISYRCINENLPRFLDNIKKFNIVKEALPPDVMSELDNTVYSNIGFYLKDIFCVDYYSFVLAQSGIDKYNDVIGGHSDESKAKTQGLNEYINQFNQHADKSKRLPLFTPLYKQILSDREAISFIPEKFSDANELLTTVNSFCVNDMVKCLDGIKKLFADINLYNADGIFIASRSAISTVSSAVFGHWDAVFEAWRAEYREQFPMKKNTTPESYEDKMKNKLKQKASFSLNEIQTYGQIFKTDDCPADVISYLKNVIFEHTNSIKANYAKAKTLLTTSYDERIEKKLHQNKDATDLLKRLLDSIKDLEHTLKGLKGSVKEENKDFSFYGDFTKHYEALCKIDPIYDKVRNYMTQKPYSTDKIKLNFDNSHFMHGWSLNQEIANSSQLFKCGENEYYLGIINKQHNKIFKRNYTTPTDEADIMFKICYEQISNAGRSIPNLIFENGKAKNFTGRKDSDGINRRLEQTKMKNLPDEINKIRLRNGYRVNIENSTREEVTKFIEYYINVTKEYYSKYNFTLKEASKYNSFAEFIDDIDKQAYQMIYEKISKKQLFDYVDKGYIYLFKIYNKDFSKHSRGKPNLHTMYFRMLFDERNLANVVYQLNGGAEMFYREASIKENELVVHYAHQKLKSKNPDNPKYNTFEYDLIQR